MELWQESLVCPTAGTQAGASSMGPQFSEAHELEADQFTPQAWEGSGLEVPTSWTEWRGEGKGRGGWSLNRERWDPGPPLEVPLTFHHLCPSTIEARRALFSGGTALGWLLSGQIVELDEYREWSESLRPEQWTRPCLHSSYLPRRANGMALGPSGEDDSLLIKISRHLKKASQNEKVRPKSWGKLLKANSGRIRKQRKREKPYN